MSLKVRIILAATLLSLMFFVAVYSSSGQQRASNADQAQVVDAVKAIFSAAANDDLAKFHAVIVPGFYIYDAGARFDGDAIMTLIKAEHAKGRRYEWNVTEPDVHVIGDTAWIAYVNKGAVTDESGTRAQSWLESAFLERRGGAWKIVFMHSTRVPVAPPASTVSMR
ncbi:nuclear transport factor 2 family protein [Tunturiibacter gelidoferens]|uniref:Nuclear transport factor 2 family protein n=2 Tax=Tunturiibacter gelidiferens TaxID=3069689 RepID=A0AAU7Z676_9BACT|nr:nuclear transport factor 2 family protein [Edaphobacter lichenicola]MBB5339493.1 ketosteroid isomerase-like protein [Edaphobacter lichenicola]